MIQNGYLNYRTELTHSATKTMNHCGSAVSSAPTTRDVSLAVRHIVAVPCQSRLKIEDYYLIREIKTGLNIKHITVNNNT